MRGRDSMQVFIPAQSDRRPRGKRRWSVKGRQELMLMAQSILLLALGMLWAGSLAGCALLDQGKGFVASFVVEKGRKELKKKKPNEAIRYCNYALHIDPNHARAYAVRGAAFHWKAEFNRAFEDFNTAIALDPNLAEAYCGRGAGYIVQARLDKALEDAHKALAIDSNLPAGYLIRGLVLMIQGHSNKALQDFDHAIFLDSRYAPAYWSRATLWAFKGDFERAKQDAQKACELGVDEGCRMLRMQSG